MIQSDTAVVTAPSVLGKACKSKTGCTTCKHRRVKCDETKPACRRCYKAKVQCEGFEEPQTGKPRMRKSEGFRRFVHVAGPSPTIKSRQTYAGLAEASAYVYFSRCTLNVLQQLEPESGWLRCLLHVYAEEPVLRHVCIALGSLHSSLARRLGSSRDTQVLRHNTTVIDPFALKHYARAMRIMRQNLNKPNVDSTVFRLACIIFVIFESLQGHQQELLMHLSSGLLLPLNRGTSTVSDGTGKVLKLLSMSCALLGRPPSRVSYNLLRLTCPGPELPLPPPTNFTRAREGLHILIGCTLRFIQTNNELEQNELADTDESVAKGLLEEKLLAWHNQLYDQALPEDSWVSEDPLRVNFLLAKYETALIFLRAHGTNDETIFDTFKEKFERILELMTPVILQNHDNWIASRIVFTLDFGVNFILFAVAVKCRDFRIRRRALELLQQAPQYEVFWDTYTTVKAVQAVIDHEESGLDDGATSVPLTRRVYAVDIQHFYHYDSSVRVIVLSTKPEGPTSSFRYQKVYI